MQSMTSTYCLIVRGQNAAVSRGFASLFTELELPCSFSQHIEFRRPICTDGHTSDDGNPGAAILPSENQPSSSYPVLSEDRRKWHMGSRGQQPHAPMTRMEATMRMPSALQSLAAFKPFPTTQMLVRPYHKWYYHSQQVTAIKT